MSDDSSPVALPFLELEAAKATYTDRLISILGNTGNSPYFLLSALADLVDGIYTEGYLSGYSQARLDLAVKADNDEPGG